MLRSRAYIIGRTQESADRIISECKLLDPLGSYIFIKADTGLIRVVDEVCKEIKKKEKNINILFLSQGVRSFDRSSKSLHIRITKTSNIERRNFRGTPPPRIIKLLLPPSLHHQPPTSPEQSTLSPPRRVSRRRYARRSSRLL